LWRAGTADNAGVQADLRQAKLNQLNTERAEFVKNKESIQAKRLKQAQAEVSRLAEIDRLSEGFRSEFVEGGVLANQQVKETIREEHELAVKSIMQTQALVLPSITTAAEKLKDEYQQAKLERAASRARKMAAEASAYFPHVPCTHLLLEFLHG
jgi:hypothetical protein